MRFIATLTASFAVMSSVAAAEEIDLSQKINELLGPAKLRELSAKAPCGGGVISFECHGIRFRNVKLTQVSTDYSDLKPAALPETIVGETFTLRNCSSSERTETHTTTLEYVDGYSITKTDTISNTMGAKAEFNIFGQKAGMSESQTVTFSDTRAENHSTKRTVTENISEKMLPYTDLTIKIEKRVTLAYLDFSGVARVSAQIVMDIAGGAHGWDFPIAPLTDVIKDPTITLRGQIWNARGEDIRKSVQEIKYTVDTCPKGDPQPTNKFTNVVVPETR
jgi:hypothetical protein